MITLETPFGFSPDGRTSRVSGEYPVLATYIRNLLLTRIGERVMLPDYGSEVASALFEPMGPNYEAELQGDIRDAIRVWEPGAEVVDVTIRQEETAFHIDVSFRARSNLEDDRVATLSVSIDVGGTVQETIL